MRRDNQARTMKGHKPTHNEQPPPKNKMKNPLDFVTPTEMVTLPSGGRYPVDHPLHGVDTLEIKFMTAKHEDILASRSLLKSGMAIERLIDSLIIDERVRGRDLMSGDRSSILIHARASAYGRDYKTTITCPQCGNQQKMKFDLGEYDIYGGDEFNESEVTVTDRGTYEVKLPFTDIVAEIRPLYGADEQNIIKKTSKKSKKNSEEPETLVTDQMKAFVVAFNGYSERNIVEQVVDNLSMSDARYLRIIHGKISPTIEIKQDFQCNNCDHEQEVDVPFGTDFFWPDR